jgi:two-component system phosphate regulon sensor histidine kinase PhoR/two-component system sensor histidine kinase VicK
MAVNNSNAPETRLIRDYMPTILPAFFTSAMTAFLLLVTETVPLDNPALFIIPLVVMILSAAGNLLVFIYMSTPLNELMLAIARVSGESNHGPLPNPSDQKNIKSGLRPALEAIYALDRAPITMPHPHTTSDEGATKPPTLKALDSRMHGSLIALGADGTIAYASKTSPLVTIDGILRPQLLFSNDNSLDTWLEECHTSAIKAEKSWRRIPSRPADEEDARIYDVYASYEKGAQYETILTLVDQTELYKDGEEDLNFIAFAAHELRGPITVIRGYLDVLEDELSDVLVDDQKELFRRLTVSANRLSGYINNILNTSRYDRRHLNVSLVSDSLASIYATIADDMSLRASSQNRLLSVAISTDLPNIAADRASLGEVISNLIDNAIKYSNEGSAINVTAEHVGDFVELSVVDHGIGMPGSVVKNLFQKFYRSHRSRETVAGTGIGLYISKAIVESHGGTISVRSAEGEGSTFTVAIPTYASLAEKLNSSNNNNQGIISKGNGWIKNHSMYRG